ncbi:hypothetical protein [Lichenicola sp.]|uniref:hypothetical protein n=1 Tax=Lichenicola sp. TaxID=2804529 RepID=UPI003B00971E
MRAAGFGSLLLLTGAALVGPGRGAHAQGMAGPPLMPSRDVSVIYSVQPEGAPQPQSVHVYFRGGGGLMRVDGPPGPDGASQGEMIMDRSSRVMTVVLNGPRVFMQIPEQEEVRSPFVLDASMHFTQTGTGTVAGIPCTQWSIVTGKGNAVACVSADGVVLSESGVDGQGARGQLVAQEVKYGPLPESLFVPPPGFQRTAHPENMGGGMNGGPGQGGPALGGPVGAAPGMMPQGGPGAMPGGQMGGVPGQ